MDVPAAAEMVVKTRRVIVLQIVIGVLVSAGFFFGKSQWHALSASWGASISLLSTLWLRRGVNKAGEQAGHGKQSEAILYIGAALRFLMVLVLFAVGLAGIKLAPVATVTGFILTQLAFAVSAIQVRQKV